MWISLRERRDWISWLGLEDEIESVFVQLDQSTFESIVGAIDTRIISITSDGQIVLDTSSLTTRREFTIQLTVNSNKNIHDTASATTNFVVTTKYCDSDFSSAISGNHELIHYLRDDTEQLVTFVAQD